MRIGRPLRILHLEDDPDYVELTRSVLKNEGVPAEITLATNKHEFEHALRSTVYDLILADYRLPGLDGLEALRLARQFLPGVPFLLVSGTVGEEAAIEALRCGATDYVLKQWPERLVPAVLRAVEEAEERSQRRRIETELVRRERYFRTLTENALDILTILTRDGSIIYTSPSVKRVLGYDSKELTGSNVFEMIHPEDRARVAKAFQICLRQPEHLMNVESRCKTNDGKWRYLESVGPNRLGDPDIGAIVINSRDISDRKSAEAELRESEHQYRLIFDENSTPMWVFDHETLAFLEVNDAAVQHYGYSREEFLKMTMRDLWPKVDELAMFSHLERMLSGPSSRQASARAWRHLKKDGTTMEVEVKWSPTLFKGRKASLNMATDITERRRIEHRDATFAILAQRLSSATSPQEAAGIIRAIADDLFRWDALMVNLYSASTDKVIPLLRIDTDAQGKRFECPVGQPEEPSQRTRRIMAYGPELLLREAPVVFSPDITRVGDVTRPSASLMFVPIRNRTKVIGFLSIQSYTLKAYTQQDLSTLQMLADHCGGAVERIRAEQALHESEMLFHSVWENSVDGMRLTDAEGRIVAVNEAFCRLVGMQRQELEGRLFTVVDSSTDDSEVALEKYRRRFGARVVEPLMERHLVLKNGSLVTFQDTSSFVELGGRPPLLFALSRDVTSQKRLEDQLRQAQKMEAIGQLAGGVAHDFNNILTVIQGHAALLLAVEEDNPAACRSAEQIRQASERAATLTRQLLTFSRRQVIQPVRLDLNEVVGNMTKMLGRILGEDIALQLSYCPHNAPVLADVGMLEQVLLNLAVNSRDAMPKGGLLSVRVSLVKVEPEQASRHPDASVGEFACLTVLDTGCGIPPDNLRRIFEPFFTTKEVGKGTGLGLATVYGIIKQHEGWVEVTSEVNRGTTFKVFLPISVGITESPTGQAEEPEVRGGNETILVVEDEAPLRDYVCNLLSRHGYNILQAESGVKALEVWKEHSREVDLLLTDLVMPDHVNGRELAEKLCAERPKLKVIFTSGYSADVVGTDFVLQAGLHYLQKPYHPQKLARTVRSCLDAKE